jgi:predicted enzyme related to lactoylglutathione lyase/heme-degrading monooxygenase HmoA
MRTLCDHLDVRVKDVAAARRFYEPFCAALGLTHVEPGPIWTTFESSDPSAPFLAITADPSFAPSPTRIALRADSREDVDRIAQAAKTAGATHFEEPALCPEYAEGYYAAFFDDPDGNRLEVCYRPNQPAIARLWRGRVRQGKLEEYREYVASSGLADYAGTEGNRGAFMLTAPRLTHGDVLTLSLWSSREAIAGFAGEPIDRARYYPRDEEFLLDFPEHVEHFDVTFA